MNAESPDYEKGFQAGYGQAEAKIAKLLVNEASAALRVQRLTELYKSACTISEQRRQELAALKVLIPEIKEAIEYAVECADDEKDSEFVHSCGDAEQTDDYRAALERSNRYLALYKKLEAIQ